ncbi:MAG: PAS domain-containing protein [bacterium]|nr:PAS domain-containing protein [bacterium]
MGIPPGGERRSDGRSVEDRLRESEDRYRTLLRNLPQKIFYKDRDSAYVLCNESYAADLGITPDAIKGMTDAEFFPPELAAKYRADDVRVMQSGAAEEFEEEYVRGGEPRAVRTFKAPVRDKGGAVIGVFGVFWDITERKRMEDERRRLEARLEQARKAESLGVMAGGIAHDFNNILSAIKGHVDVALMRLAKSSRIRGNLEEIARAADRAARLCRQMFASAGDGSARRLPVDLGEAVRETARLVKGSISPRAAVTYRLASGLPPIEADPSRVVQVVMNLILNAAEAVGGEGGTILVSTGLAEYDRGRLDAALLGDRLPEGPYVHLEVADTGCGMDEETRRRIFDPFFTTKFVGRGLGLAAVLGIVRAHGWAIMAESAPGRGTKMRVLFPVRRPPPPGAAAEPA